MDIKIRGVDPGLMKTIDEMAKAGGISRNEYLKNRIEELALYPKILETENRYAGLVKQAVEVIERNNEVMEIVLNEINRKD